MAQALFPKYQNYLFLVKPQQNLIVNGIGLSVLEMAQILEEYALPWASAGPCSKRVLCIVSCHI